MGCPALKFESFHFVDEGEAIRLEFCMTGEAVDISGKTIYAYDILGRISSEEKQSAGGATLSLVTHQYDKAGNRVSVAYPGGKTLAFTYDKRNLLSTVIDGTDETVYSYDANGNRTGLSLPNGVVTTTAFDAANRVTQLENIKDSVGIYTTEYFMDKVGNRLKITENRPGSSRNLVYTYDQTYRLISETDDLSGSPVTTSYTYDDAGNRTLRVISGPSGDETTTYTVDQLNRVTSATNGTDVTNYSYDVNGNRIAKSSTGVSPVNHSYNYDRENRLISANEGASALFSAVYDYRTRRMEKTENGITVKFVYDSGVNVQEYTVDAVGDSSLTKQIVRGTGMGGGIGSVLYTETISTSTKEFFCYNAIGSVVALSDTSGVVTATTDYEAFGKIVRETGDDGGESRKFCTKERSASIGLDNFGHRYFDWELGRFTTRDPSGYPDSPNNYLYVNSNPINGLDPLGLKKKSDYEEDIKIIEEVKQQHHEAWKKQNKYDDATDKQKSKLDRKWKKEAKRYDKAVDEIKKHIEKIDKLIEKHREKHKHDFGYEERDGDWDDEYTSDLGQPPGKLGGERLDRWLTKQIMIGIGVNYATAGAGNILRPGVLKILQKFLGGDKARAFWSGGGKNPVVIERVRVAAEAWAKAHGANTLEQSTIGEIMDKIARGSKIGDRLMQPLWKPVSKLFSQGTDDAAHVFQSASEGVSTNSAWATTEYKELTKKGTEIIYHTLE